MTIWSDPQKWLKQIHETKIGRNKFNDHRTSYMISTIESGFNKVFCNIEKISREDKLKLIKKEGRKAMILPLSPQTPKIEEPYDTLNKLFNKITPTIKGQVPSIGYESIQSFFYLNSHNTNVEEIKFPYLTSEIKDSPEKGVEFLFGEVLPTIEKLVR